MNMQAELFAANEVPVPPKPDPHAGTDMESLKGLAILYTATELGNNSGIRFMMTVEDAMRWCDSPASQGVLHGTAWAYFWTSLANYVNCYWMGEEPIIDLRNALDDGSWDKRIEEAGCKKISVWEFSKVLNPLGVKVINEPSRISRAGSSAKSWHAGMIGKRPNT